jgi:phosphatidylglycerol:prolipoprotein diacylglycerol transferase
LNLPISFESSGLRIFAFTLHWYGIVVVASAWIGAEVATWLAARDERDPGHVWRGLIWVSLFGIAGARLWYVLFPPDSVVANGLTAGWLLSHFFDLNQGAIAVWTGGTGLIGGIVGGVIGLAIYTRRNVLPLLPWLDIAAVALALAQAIGRWANAASLDLYGAPTDLPWGVLVSAEEQRVGMYRDLSQFPLSSTRFHPVYAYESFLMVVVFVVLLVAFLRNRDRLKHGDIALLYVALYGSGRFLLEFLRVNVSHVGAVNISQAVVLVAAAIAVIALYRRKRTNLPDLAGGSAHNIQEVS